MDAIFGRLELTIKITQLPKATPAKDGWQQFTVNCDGITIEATVRPKVWNKLTQAASQWPQWVAAITGKVGKLDGSRIVLDQPAIQVFEKKPKEAATESAAGV